METGAAVTGAAVAVNGAAGGTSGGRLCVIRGGSAAGVITCKSSVGTGLVIVTGTGLVISCVVVAVAAVGCVGGKVSTVAAG